MTPFDGKSILLLEDEALLAIHLETMFATAGFSEVISFRSCEQAWDYLQTETPDVAVVDFYRRHLLCRSVIAELAARHVPFVIHSGTLFQVQLDDRELAAFRWISKPSNPDDIIEALRETIEAAELSIGASGSVTASSIKGN